MSRRARQHFFLIALLICSGTVYARYGHQGFASLYVKADAIVLGEIVAVDNTAFQFRSDEVFRSSVKAPLQAGNVTQVRRFHNWRCAARWTDYRKGQHLLLFLQRLDTPQTRSPTWRALGAAAEGGMPVENGHLYVGAVGDGSPINDSHIVYGASYPSRAFPLATVLTGLRTGELPEDLLLAPLHSQPTTRHGTGAPR